jgi:hypothetical protein
MGSFQGYVDSQLLGLLPTLPNPSLVPLFSSNTPSGNSDPYTVPANRRACILGGTFYNSSGGVINVYLQTKISGTYYRISTITFATAGGTGSFPVPPYCAEAGETISLHADVTGMNIWLRLIEFDATSSMKSPRLTSLSAGNNTLYTVTSGKKAAVFGSAVSSLFTNQGAVNYINDSGGARTIVGYAVPNAGSAGTANEFQNSIGIANGASVTSLFGPPGMGSGDFIVLNADAGTATQFAWVTVYER